jgi:proteasome assembly chaperone (PAC2) family protein
MSRPVYKRGLFTTSLVCATSRLRGESVSVRESAGQGAQRRKRDRPKDPPSSNGDQRTTAMKKDSSFENAIKLESRPQLKLPIVFAAWPGMGNVALNAARYLVEKLGAAPLARIEASEFASAEGVRIRNHIVLPVEVPEYRFYYWKHPEKIGDLIIFVGDHQPFLPRGYAMARLVLKLANWFGARRIYSAAALACSISHMDSPRVWAVATHSEILAELKDLPIQLLSEGHISGLNGLILGVGKQMGFEGVCLLGELPYYTVGTDNPKSSLAVLEQLCTLWRIRVDFSELREASIRKEIEIEEFIRAGNERLMVEELVKKGSTEGETPQ